MGFVTRAYVPSLRASGVRVARTGGRTASGRERRWQGGLGEEMALREEDHALGPWLAPLLLDFDALGDSGGPEIFGEFEELRRDRGAVRISVRLP